MTQLTNQKVADTVNKPIDEPLERYLTRYSPPFYAEPKYDGERVLLQVGDTITIANKHKTVYPETVLPLGLVEAIREDVCRGVYDCEFYSLRGNLYKFLSARAKLNEDLALAVFDIPLTEHQHTSLSQRKQLLKKCIQKNDRVHLVGHTICQNRYDILQAFHKYLKRGFEGVVVKPNSDYYAKWLKLKEQHTADMVLLAVKKTKSWNKDRLPYTFRVGVYQNGSFREIGDVSSGLTLNEKQAIGEVVSDLKRSEDSDYIYLKPELVLEIEYHQRTEKGLREPKIKRIRLDKNPKECDRIDVKKAKRRAVQKTL